MDWNKLKKATINAASIFGGLAIVFACVIGVNYIALANPIVAIFIGLVILFCLLVVIYYLISQNSGLQETAVKTVIF